MPSRPSSALRLRPWARLGRWLGQISGLNRLEELKDRLRSPTRRGPIRLPKSGLALETLERRWLPNDPLGELQLLWLPGSMFLGTAGMVAPDGGTSVDTGTPAPTAPVNQSAPSLLVSDLPDSQFTVGPFMAAPDPGAAPAPASPTDASAAAGSPAPSDPFPQDPFADPFASDPSSTTQRAAAAPADSSTPPPADAGSGPPAPASSSPSPDGPAPAYPTDPNGYGGLNGSGGYGSYGPADAAITVTGVPFAPVKGTKFNGPVATFSYAGATAADFTATIKWGDGSEGNLSVGTVQQNADGTFQVLGSNTYLTLGPQTVTIKVTHRNGDTGQGTVNVTVAPAAPRVTGTPIRVREGVQFNAEVGWFVDPGIGAQATDFTATISWGDNSPLDRNTSIAANGQDGFKVGGTHRYTRLGEYPIGVTVTYHPTTENLSASATTKAVVTNGPLFQPSATPLSATKGTLFSSQIATFVDPSPPPDGRYSVTVDWGDDTPLDTTATVSGTGPYIVTGTHLYTAAGVFAVTLTIRSSDGSSTTQQDKAIVTDSVAALSSNINSITEGQPFAGVVASFSDPNPDAQVTDYTATITWESGQSTAGTVRRAGAGSFNVNGSYTYQSPGPKTVVVNVLSARGGTRTLTQNITVQDASVSLTVAPDTAYKGQSYSGVIARFTDANPLALPGDFSATIDFIDPDAGILQQTGVIVPLGNGAFEITAPITFPAVRSYNLRVGLTHERNPQSATGSIVVRASDYIRMLPGVGMISAVKGQDQNYLLARFLTNNGNDAPGDYLVTVQWGDGTQEVTPAGSGGNFRVSANHTYRSPRDYTATVTVQERSHSENSATMSVGAIVQGNPLSDVNHDPLQLSVQEGRVYGQTYFNPDGTTEYQTSGIVAVFTDPSPEPDSAYTALIDWGNGYVNRGRIVRRPGSNDFEVRGTNLYLEESSTAIPIKTLVTDNGVSPLQIVSQMTVTEGTLRAQPWNTVGVTGHGQNSVTVAGIVATFWEGPFDPKEDFTASIDWGDRSRGSGEIRGGMDDNGGHSYYGCGYYYYRCAAYQFQVYGTHTYSTDSQTDFTVTTTITNRSGGSQTVTITVSTLDFKTQRDPNITVHSAHISAREMTPFSGDVATFDSQYPDGTTFTATITWNNLPPPSFLPPDPHPVIVPPDVATVTRDMDGVWHVHGEHVYSIDGEIPFTVSVSPDCSNFACLYTSWDDGSATVASLGGEDITLTTTGTSISAIKGQAFSNQQVASFGGAPGVAASNCEAFINWGDSSGAEDRGQVSADFKVTGSHTYAKAGNYQIRVRIVEHLPLLPYEHPRDDGRGMIQEGVAYANAEVAAPPYDYVRGDDISGTAGQPISDALVAAFGYQMGHLPAGISYNAKIYWGDDKPASTGRIELQDNYLNVKGDHTYDHPGSYRTRVILSRQLSSTAEAPLTGVADAGATVTAPDPPPDKPRVINVQPITGPKEGDQVSLGPVQFGLPPGDLQAPSCHKATIDWGDNTPTIDGNVSDNRQGTVSVTGSHTYPNQGVYPVKVTYQCWSGTVTAYTTAAIDDREFSTFLGHALPTSSATWGGWDGNWYSYWNSNPEDPWYYNWRYWNDWWYDCYYGGNWCDYVGPGSNASPESNGFNNVVVATFSDFDNKDANAFTATIHWGDGSTTPNATIVRGTGTSQRQFQVLGSHTYSFKGTYIVGVDIIHDGIQTLHTTTTANVVEASALEPAFFHVGSFRNKNYLKPFTWSQINWGDGSPPSPSSSGWGYWGPGGSGWYWGFYGWYWSWFGWGANTINVAGTHIYYHEGTYNPQATAYYRSQSITGGHLVQVADAPLVVRAALPVLNLPEYSGSPDILAYVVDLDPAGAADNKAIIYWGDGGTSVTPDPMGAGAIVGAHTYNKPGQYTIYGQVEPFEGGDKAVTGFLSKARVYNPGLAVTVNDLGALENMSTGEIAVATVAGLGPYARGSRDVQLRRVRPPHDAPGGSRRDATNTVRLPG